LDCEILIDLYTEVSPKKGSGFKVYYDEKNETSLKLAECINKAMEEKLQLPNLGIFQKSFGYTGNIIPIGVVPAMEDVRIDRCSFAGCRLQE